MTNEDHYDGLLAALRDALNHYVRYHSHGVRADVVQAVLGELVIETFEYVTAAEARAELLDDLCLVLREGVDGIDAEAVAQATEASKLQ